MKALILNQEQEIRLRIEEFPRPIIAENQALVRMIAAALNHRDQWIREGKYSKIQYPSILGSDGCGIVEEVGTPEDAHWIGKEVVINPNIAWGNDPKAQSKDYQILGMPSFGTFAEFCALPVHRLHEKPTYLSSESGAGLPLGGMTAFRAVKTQAKISKGEKVLITGIGGGVALFALQFAIHIGAEVFVTSGSSMKIEKAQKFGAISGVNYKNDGWEKELQKLSGSFDVIIDSAGGEQFNALLGLLKPAGRIVTYGATLGKASVDFAKIFWKQLIIQGTTMATDEEFPEMLNFVVTQKITPILDSVRPFDDIISAFDTMKNGEHFGKLVVKL